MLPDLLQATHDYWQKLNALEAAYRQGEVSLEEVDARVAELTAELGAERRAALRFFFDGLHRLWHEQQEMIIGVGLVGILTFVWVTVNAA